MDSKLDTWNGQDGEIRLVSLLPGLFFLFALAFPIVGLIFRAVSLQMESPPYDLILHAIEISSVQALLSAVISGIIGVCLALAYVDSGFKITQWLWPLSLVCFSLPTLVVCLSLIGFWGKSGWLGFYLNHAFGLEFYGWFGILVAHTYMNYSIFFRSVSERLLSEGRILEKASLGLGASRWQTFRCVTWPKIAPALMNASLLVFAYCFTSFLVVLLLGGGAKFSTLEVLIYEAIRLDQDLALGLVLASLQLLFCAVVLMIVGRVPYYSKVEKGADYPVYGCRNRMERTVVVSFLFAFLVFVLSPFLVLCIEGMGSFGKILSTELFRVTSRSIVLSLSVGIVGLVVGGSSAYTLVRGERSILQKCIEVGSAVPLLFSVILISTALFYFYGSFPVFRTTLLGPFIVQVLMATPIVCRILKESFQRIPTSQLRAASSLGASNWQRLFWLEIPSIRNSIQLAFSLAAALSVGEVGSLLLWGVAGEGVLPLWIYREMGRYHFGEAAAGSVVLLLVLTVFLWKTGRQVR